MKEIKLSPVTSSNIESHGYDEESKTLAIKFKRSSGVYHYPGVEKSVYQGLSSAKSVGSFVSQHIKGRKFTVK